MSPGRNNRIHIKFFCYLVITVPKKREEVFSFSMIYILMSIQKMTPEKEKPQASKNQDPEHFSKNQYHNKQ